MVHESGSLLLRLRERIVVIAAGEVTRLRQGIAVADGVLRARERVAVAVDRMHLEVRVVALNPLVFAALKSCVIVAEALRLRLLLLTR